MIPTLLQGDCLDLSKSIKPESVHLIATDLPYGITQNKWDIRIPVKDLWDMFIRVLTPNGVIALTATMQLAVCLLEYAPAKQMFKYDLVWEKTISSGQLNVNRMPLRSHEHILIFSPSNQYTYNETLLLGKPYKITRTITDNPNYGKQQTHSANNTGTRRARSVIKISNPRIKNGHPNQKPVSLMDFVIKTYSNNGDIVFDPCMGSGTTGVSCSRLSRNFIGIEQNVEYFNYANSRLLTTPLFRCAHCGHNDHRTAGTYLCRPYAGSTGRKPLVHFTTKCLASSQC